MLSESAKQLGIERVEQGDWPSKVEVTDKLRLGFPIAKSHYKVIVHWNEFMPEGSMDPWPSARHVFWARWSDAEEIASAISTIVNDTIKGETAKGGDVPEPLSFSLDKKLWGDKGDPYELHKRMQELGAYLESLRGWGAGLQENTVLWDWVRLTGPLKGFWTQKDKSGKGDVDGMGACLNVVATGLTAVGLTGMLHAKRQELRRRSPTPLPPPPRLRLAPRPLQPRQLRPRRCEALMARSRARSKLTSSTSRREPSVPFGVLSHAPPLCCLPMGAAVARLLPRDLCHLCPYRSTAVVR